MSLLAEITSGHSDAADILFLVAAVLAGLAAVLAWSARPLAQPAAYAALCLLAVGWLVL